MDIERRLERVVPWLDSQTRQALQEALAYLLERRDDVQAVILYGSVARRTARPLNDPDPSDVDVLVLFRPEPGLDTVSPEQRSAVAWANVEIIDRYPQALPLDLMPTLYDLARCDASFIANVAHDGVVLWQSAALPGALHTLDEYQPLGS